MIKTTLPIGEGDYAAAPEPCGDLLDSGRISNQAGCCEHHIIIDIIPFQLCQGTASAGHIGEGNPLRRDRHRRLFQYMDTILCETHAVPLKPVVHVTPPFGEYEKRRPKGTTHALSSMNWKSSKPFFFQNGILHSVFIAWGTIRVIDKGDKLHK